MLYWINDADGNIMIVDDETCEMYHTSGDFLISDLKSGVVYRELHEYVEIEEDTERKVRLDKLLNNHIITKVNISRYLDNGIYYSEDSGELTLVMDLLNDSWRKDVFQYRYSDLQVFYVSDSETVIWTPKYTYTLLMCLTDISAIVKKDGVYSVYLYSKEIVLNGIRDSGGWYYIEENKSLSQVKRELLLGQGGTR